MNSTKIFFTLAFFFTFAIASQAQVDNNLTKKENITSLAKKTDIKLGQVEGTLATGPNTTATAGSNITTASQPAEAIVFYFNHKQFLKPIVRKSALS